MAFVGTFLKNTTRVGYNYGVKRKVNNPEAIQDYKGAFKQG
jgi:hypothetical protein